MVKNTWRITYVIYIYIKFYYYYNIISIYETVKNSVSARRKWILRLITGSWKRFAALAKNFCWNFRYCCQVYKCHTQNICSQIYRYPSRLSFLFNYRQRIKFEFIISHGITVRSLRRNAKASIDLCVYYSQNCWLNLQFASADRLISVSLSALLIEP